MTFFLSTLHYCITNVIFYLLPISSPSSVPAFMTISVLLIHRISLMRPFAYTCRTKGNVIHLEIPSWGKAIVALFMEMLLGRGSQSIETWLIYSFVQTNQLFETSSQLRQKTMPSAAFPTISNQSHDLTRVSPYLSKTHHSFLFTSFGNQWPKYCRNVIIDCFPRLGAGEDIYV